MHRRIDLPAHLYDRIKASAGEHGGIGAGCLFRDSGEPVCAHGHAWGSQKRYESTFGSYEEPELRQYISTSENDDAVLEYFGADTFDEDRRIPFDTWCALFNVHRADTPSLVGA